MKLSLMVLVEGQKLQKKISELKILATKTVQNQAQLKKNSEKNNEEIFSECVTKLCNKTP